MDAKLKGLVIYYLKEQVLEHKVLREVLALEDGVLQEYVTQPLQEL
jgi:hypothetical protein